ncbi:MAG: NADH:flavin oxidoreductase, partial [Solirubrobacteraceae bacterium]|nr:NADH:flavin oxidoreductase [Solirubrobacteraceae bacterium]
TRLREAYFLEYAEKVRSVASMPLMLTGGLRSRAGMDEALATGAVDLIGLGRPTCLDPGLPAKLIDGTLAGAVDPRELSTGIKPLDNVAELGWHTTQLWRLGAGKDVARDRHPLLASLEYIGQTAVGGIARRLTRPPQY